MDMEASLFDMDLDLLGSWDLSQLLAAPDVLVSEQARGPGLSSPAGPWSLVDPSGPSPVDEVPQDSLWLDPTDVVRGSPELFSGLQQDDYLPQYKKLSSSFLFDDDSQALPLSSDFLLSSDSVISPASGLGTSPIDVKFEFGDVRVEFGDVLSDDQALDYLTDSSPRVIDNVFPLKTLPTFEHSTTFTPCQPEYILRSYDGGILLVDSAVPTSPLTESCSSPLDTLEYDEDDSLHDAENVYQLLMALDGGVEHGTGGLHSTSQILSHVSPEEVESVLSRDSSSDDLMALCETSMELCDNAASTVSIEFDARCASGLQVKRGFGISTARPPMTHSSTVSSAACLPLRSSATIGSVSQLPIASAVSGYTGAYTIASPTGSLPAVIVSEYHGTSLTSKMDSCSVVKSRAAPYGEVQTERRVRKKEQNKTAALRYRQKKREEKGHTMTEVEELEQQNQVLKNRADELSKEISYLRGLLEEITR